MSLQPLVENIVKNLVEEPEAVTVEEIEDRGAQVFNVTVAPNDVGRIIGKDGRVITCVRHIVGAAGSKQRQKTYVKIVTED
ncbi:MAG: KH domain-containing protein [Armatimonadetes bacterium]|nr:KH domain-containing protein [Armatimonadota bacterium]